MRVEFYRHDISEEDIHNVNEVLRSRFLTTGPITKRFEKDFSDFLGVKHGVGVSSWTSGHFITLQALEIGAGDEVITSPLSFIATPNTILHAGALPVFVDVEADTGNISPDLVEKAITPKTKAICPVHLYGQMANMIELSSIAQKHGLRLIEDAAHCVEGSLGSVRPGVLSDAAVFSFYATKNMTSGEGGIVVTNNDSLKERLDKFRLHGMSKSAIDRYSSEFQHWDMELLGYKCNMSDIQAALLTGQLARKNETLKRRAQIADRYDQAIDQLPDVRRPVRKEGSIHAHHLYTIWVDRQIRDQVLFGLQGRGIGVAVNFRPIHLLTYYQERFGFSKNQFPNAEEIGDSTISLPFYPGLKEDEIQYVVDNLSDILVTLKKE